ncbi:amidohydrolase family protein [Altererythrobacter aerius]|uniref:Amidohydrolase family protein n=1 Tax=Tsuneonella aeria TaxID=1837929 RepID=A0A6I4TCE8_9SPHN|nr:amidohydrolase family protein [Tsuneonella aeria]
MSAYDLVIRGGTVVDGSGGAPFVGDVAVNAGRIAAVGAVTGRGAEEIDATGRIVTPGFVDPHTHYDGQAIWSDRLSPSSSHGVTSVVLGNCGVGFAPCRAEDRETLIDVMEGVEDIPGVVMADGLPWSWETFPQYLDALEAGLRDIDVAAFLPHSPLRVYAMGARGANREPANDDDLATMRGLAREAIEAGAIGFATSRLLIHKTASGAAIPSFDADTDELKAITAGMAEAGSGILQVVPNLFLGLGPEFALIADVAESCGRPATVTLGTANDGAPNWDGALEVMDGAGARGVSMTSQVLPRPIGMIEGLELSVHPFVLCPSWQALAKLPLDEKLAAMRDPHLRANLIAEEPDPGHPLAQMARNWEWLFPFAGEPDYAPAKDTSVAALAARANVSPPEWAYDWLTEGAGGNFLLATLGNYYEGRLDVVKELLSRPDCIVGLGDGGAHYSAICDASYPTFMLTHWVRDARGEGFSLEQAVHMLSRKPALAIGLGDRGLIAPGMKADLNVIDLDRLHLPMPHVAYDLPAGGRRLDQRATGYDATVVAGTVIRRFDEDTGARPGRLVRGAR